MSCPRTLPRKNPEDLVRLEPRIPGLRVKHLTTEPRGTLLKAEKHLKISMLAKAKLDTIASHISEALMDNKISDDEFQSIMEELNKYKAMKEEIRNNTKKRIKEEEERNLERGRQEARESFRKLAEKSKTGI